MIKFFIADSRINGKGVFAAENVKKGETVFILRGKKTVLTTEKSIMSTPNMVGLEKDTWIDPEPPIDYLNHSCDPNLGMRGRFLFVALKNIKKGTELNFDYSISEDSMWEMKCSCGAKNCRGIVRGIKFLPESVYKKYIPYVPKYFQKVYQKCHNINI